jgi:GNAT superfamily N-acetyltransferase
MRIEAEPEALQLHCDVVAAGVVSPLALGGAEEALWADCDLASLAENRLGDKTDPRALGDLLRAEWRERAITERWRSPAERNFDACFWLLDGAERVGTIALSRSLFGSLRLRISSLYVLPTHRGRGAATGALNRVRAVLGKRRRGIRLETFWTWQSAARFYLQRGFWLRMWKDDLDFYAAPDVPPAIVHVDDGHASIAVDLGSEPIVLAQAKRAGEKLTFDVCDDRADVRVQDLIWDASSTLSLAIGLRGWPLIRSQRLWDDCQHSDAGPPEALAYRIAIWEALDRKHGFCVETPKIPGLEYPSWDELEARWVQSQADSE